MDMLLKFGIGADSSTFGLPRFATPSYEMGDFNLGVFKTRKFKMDFADNLHHSNISNLSAKLAIKKYENHQQAGSFLCLLYTVQAQLLTALD